MVSLPRCYSPEVQHTDCRVELSRARTDFPGRVRAVPISAVPSLVSHRVVVFPRLLALIPADTVQDRVDYGPLVCPARPVGWTLFSPHLEIRSVIAPLELFRISDDGSSTMRLAVAHSMAEAVLLILGFGTGTYQIYSPATGHRDIYIVGENKGLKFKERIESE